MTRQPTILGLVITLAVIPSVVADGPIETTIRESELALAVQLYATLPTTGRNAGARINVIREEPDGTDRLFVNDLNGFLYTIDRTTRTSTTYIDFLTEFPELKTAPGLASGLVSFAFHPEFATNGKLYTIHAEEKHSQTETVPIPPPLGDFSQTSVLTEWVAEDPIADVFSGTRREIMRLGTPGRFHPMGDVSFDPTRGLDDPDYGLLHVSIGDGQSFNLGQSQNLQRLDSYLGTILRIDPDPLRQEIISENGQYSIPSSNPWAEDGNKNTFAEIFAYGFRNPHRLTWDFKTGALLTTDIGENDLEEINIVTTGQNYGWPSREGSFRLGGSPLPNNDDELGFTYPVVQYDHDEGNAVSNALVYRDENSILHERLVFGDIANGRIFSSKLDDVFAADDDLPLTTAEISELQIFADGKKTTFLDLISDSLGNDLPRVDLRFGSDSTGRLYLMSKQSGEVYLARAISEWDCTLDGVVDVQDLACVCALAPSARDKLLFELGSVIGDLDLDGTVNFADFLTLSGNFSRPGEFLDGDLDCDGTVGFADFLILSGRWGDSATSITLVPEPAGSSWLQRMLLCQILIIAARRRNNLR